MRQRRSLFIEVLTVAIIAGLSLGSLSARAVAPKYTIHDGAVHLKGVGPDNPIIYDNDWWFDVFDNNYLWA